MHKMHTPFLSRGGVVPPGSLRLLSLSPAGAPSAGISFMHVFFCCFGYEHMYSLFKLFWLPFIPFPLKNCVFHKTA